MSVLSPTVLHSLDNLHGSKATRHGHNNKEHHEQVKEEETGLTVKVSHKVKHQVEGNGIEGLQRQINHDSTAVECARVHAHVVEQGRYNESHDRIPSHHHHGLRGICFESFKPAPHTKLDLLGVC